MSETFSGSIEFANLEKPVVFVELSFYRLEMSGDDASEFFLLEHVLLDTRTDVDKRDADDSDVSEDEDDEGGAASGPKPSKLPIVGTLACGPVCSIDWRLTTVRAQVLAA